MLVTDVMRKYCNHATEGKLWGLEYLRSLGKFAKASNENGRIQKSADPPRDNDKDEAENGKKEKERESRGKENLPPLHDESQERKEKVNRKMKRVAFGEDIQAGGGGSREGSRR